MPASRPPHIEQLDRRQLLTAPPKVITVIPDNRGEVVITFSRFVRIESNAVRVFVAGSDGQLGTSDDVRVTDTTFDFLKSRNRLTIHANLPADTPYRVQLLSEKVTSKADDGDDPVTGVKLLDGEFSGELPTGDGRNGGNFVFSARPIVTDRPLAVMSTTAGTIDLRLRADLAPNSVANFRSYADTARYDGSFFNRTVRDFVLQAGALRVAGDAENARVVQDVLDPGIAQEPLLEENSNTIGTLAFVRSGPQNLATNQFFFNLADNPGFDTADEFDDAVYTPFAELANDADRSIITGIAARQPDDLEDEIGIEIPGGLEEVPLQSPINEAGFNPFNQLVLIRRVALRMSVDPIS